MNRASGSSIPAWAQKEMDDFVEKLRAWRIRAAIREFNVNEQLRTRETWMLTRPVPKK